MQIRLLIATLMLLLAMAGKAQVFQINNTPMNFARGLKARDLLIAPKGCDTTALTNPKWGESTAGALFVDTCNNRLYFYNGLKWNQVTGGGGGVDSFYYNFRNLNDTTLLWDRGDGVVDTLAFSSGGTSLIGAYIDDIKAIGQDLYYYKNGDSTFIVNIAQGSTGGDTTIFSFVVDTTNVARFQIPYADTTGYFKGDTALTWQPSDKTLVTDNLYMYGTDASRAAKMWFKIPNPTFGYRPRIYAGMLPTDVANGAIYFSGGGSNALMEINSGDNNQLLLHSPDGEMLFKQTDGLYRFYNVPNETSYNKMLVINDSGFVAWKAPADTTGLGSLYIRNQFTAQENKKFSVIQGKVDALDFNATSSIADSTQRLTWDDGNGTLNIGLKGGQVNLAVGQEQVARVYNDAGVTLNDGDIVYITGAQGNRVKVQKAVNTDAAIAYATLGMVTETITAGSEGFVTILGTVNHLNTSSFAEGTELYLSGTAGGYTDTKPSYPAAIVSIGRVERSHATVGSIYVNVRPELPTVASYSKNAGGDSTILLLTNGQRFAAKDSTGGGGGGITIDSVAVRRIPQGTFNHYVGFNSGVGGTGTSGGNVTTDAATAGENFVIFKDAGFSFRTTGRFDGNNYLAGTSSGKWVTNQGYNIGIGYQTLGGSNTTIADSLWTSTGTGGAHIALGFQALSKIKGGDNVSRNIAIGYQALQNYTTCSGCATSNLAIGAQSLQATTTGQSNVGVGQGTLASQTTGGSNTAVGYAAVQYGNNSQNTGIGISALGGASLTGGINTAIGAYAGFSITSGNYNTLVGQYAGLDLTQGSHNVGIGTGLFNVSARPATTGNYNLAIMGESRAATTGSYNIAIGQGVQSLSLTASNQFALGGNAIRWLISDVSGSSRRWTFNGTTSDITATEASAALEVRSTSGGLLVPRMTATQASAIGTPANGNILYVTDTNATFTSVGFWGRENGAWIKL